MWRSLLTDLESVLKGAKPADLIRVPKAGPASRGEDAAAFSEWLPYRAWIADRQVFVNLDALGFCLEVRPQSGADEEMARVLTALYAASPPGTGIQFHLYASPAIRAPLARYANLRVADDAGLTDAKIMATSDLNEYKIQELLAADGPLAAFAGAETRVVFRPTSTYGELLTESCHPDVMGNALLRDRLLVGLKDIPEGETIKQGGADPRILMVRDRLQALGFIGDETGGMREAAAVALDVGEHPVASVCADNVQFAGESFSGNPKVVIRGLYINTRTTGLEPSFGIYVDGVFLARLDAATGQTVSHSPQSMHSVGWM